MPPRSPHTGLSGPYVLLLAVGVISFLIILLAFGQLVEGTAPWEHVSVRAQIQGVYHYDPTTGHVMFGPSRSFIHGTPFAARVDWAGLPAGLQVGARWYDDEGQDWGGIDPGPAVQLATGSALVPMVRTDAPPGTYTLDVMRYSAGRPVQILGTTNVKVLS